MVRIQNVHFKIIISFVKNMLLQLCEQHYACNLNLRKRFIGNKNLLAILSNTFIVYISL